MARAVVELRVVLAVAVVAALLIPVALLLTAQDEVTIPGEVYGTLDYEVTGTFLFVPFSGTVHVDLYNVTEDGYWALITVKGVPLAQSKTKYYTWEEAPAYVSDIGPKVGNATIATAFGEKRTEVFLLLQDGTEYTSYLGTDPRVVYRMTGTGNGIEVTMVLAATDLEPIRSGNAA